MSDRPTIIDRLRSFDRGTLNANKDGISGTPCRTQDWTLDQLGNWSTLNTDGTDQDRTHNAQNQITIHRQPDHPGL